MYPKTNEYYVLDMEYWDDVFSPIVYANLILLDLPFALKFNGKPSNYNRNSENVVDGYIEWSEEEYAKKVDLCLDIIYRNSHPEANVLILSGWNNSHVIHNQIINYKKLHLQGKVYWSYNFAPACKNKPAHNIYEIFWLTKNKRKWYYNNRCSFEHCQDKIETVKCPHCKKTFPKKRKIESNLSTILIKREYCRDVPKYPTRLPLKLLQVLLEHFSKEGDLVFDFLCGSGMVGVACQIMNRKFVISDANPNGKVIYNELLKYYESELAEGVKLIV